MRGAGLHQRPQLRGISTERAVSAGEPRLQRLNRTIHHNHPPRSLGKLPALRVKESPASERNDPPTLGRRRLAPADRSQASLLYLPESLLPFRGEDLRDAPPFCL